MATAGGPDSIGELRVDIVGDDSQLDAAIDRAKQKVEAAAGGGGGGATAGGTATAAATPAGGLNSGAINGAAIGVLINQMVAVAEKFEKLGESIGSMFFEGAKQQLELTQAIRQLNTSLASQQQINAGKLNQQARGVGGRAPSTAMQDRLAGFETENAAIDASLAENPTIGDALAGAAEFLTFNPFTGESDIKSRRTQMREQRADNQTSIDSLRRQQGGLIQAGRQNTSGRVLADAAEDAGIPFNPTMRNSGDAMTPANAALMGDVLKGQKQLIEMLIRQGTFEGQQQTIRQVTTQGNP